MNQSMRRNTATLRRELDDFDRVVADVPNAADIDMSARDELDHLITWSATPEIDVPEELLERFRDVVCAAEAAANERNDSTQRRCPFCSERFTVVADELGERVRPTCDHWIGGWCSDDSIDWVGIRDLLDDEPPPLTELDTAAAERAGVVTVRTDGTSSMGWAAEDWFEPKAGAYELHRSSIAPQHAHAYATAVVEMTMTDVRFTVGPATTIAQREVRFPSAENACIYVITACNPHGEVRDPAENAERTERLRAELTDRGLTHWRAVGGDPDRVHVEEGFAFESTIRHVALELCHIFEQDAIFEWSPDAWKLIAVDGREMNSVAWGTERTGAEAK